MTRRVHLSVNGAARMALASRCIGPIADTAPTEALAPGPTPDKGDTAWMLTATVLVILMTIPGLALFYGGMVRAKNVLSVLMQVFLTFSLLAVLWAIYGYSIAFTRGQRVLRRLRPAVPARARRRPRSRRPSARACTSPSTATSASSSPSPCITPCLIVGAFAERIRFSAVLGVHGDLVHLRLPADRAHGVVLGRAPTPTPTRQRAPTPRRARDSCSSAARSTSRAAPSCTSTRVSRVSSARS